MTVDPSTAPVEETSAPEDDSGSWRRALALVFVLLVTSVVRPTVLVAAPFVLLVALRGMRGGGAFFATVLAAIVLTTGRQDGVWFVERAWALMVGGMFAAVSVAKPAWRLTSRALVSVGGTALVWGAYMVVESGAWATIEWTISDELRAAYATWPQLMSGLGEGQAVSPAFASAIYRTVEAQVAVFPALVALESMAALAVAWWLHVRLLQGRDGGIAPLGRFRFNDHLVWGMVFALLLVVLRSGDAATRIGANLAVFMGALYAMRGMGVVMFVSGGLSLFGYTMFVLGFLFAAPVVIGFTVLFGIADTWLDLRGRVGSVAT